jgi:hypothetical protein
MPRSSTVSSSHSCLHGLTRWPTHTTLTHMRPTHTYTASGPTPTGAGCDKTSLQTRAKLGNNMKVGIQLTLPVPLFKLFR